jgi:small subunit ribosomal protein S16
MAFSLENAHNTGFSKYTTFHQPTVRNHSTNQEKRVAVKIRMKMMGRKHRPFFRICAIDSRNPRDGRVLEELGTYDPMVHDTDARAALKPERIAYWLGVGAKPSDKVRTLLKKYGDGGTHVEQQKAARERLALPKAVPDPGQPVYVPPVPGSEAPAAAVSESASSGGGSESGGDDSGPAAAAAEQPASASE